MEPVPSNYGAGRGSELVLESNDNYYGDKPNWIMLFIRFYPVYNLICTKPGK